MPINPIKFHPAVILLITAIAFAGVYTYIFDKKLDINGDNAKYYILAKALAGGEGYVNINSIHKRPNNHLPVGYPALISGVITVFGDSTTYIKLFNGILFLFSLAVIYFMVMQISGQESTAILVILLVMLNGHLLRYSTIIMTEVPFLFFSTAAILAITKINFNKPFWKDGWLYSALLLLSMAYYIRTSGVALIGGVIIYFLFTKRWQQALLIIIGSIILVLPWQLRSQKLGGNTYVKQLAMVNPYRPEMGTAGLGDFVNRFGNNVSRYITKEIPAATLPFIIPDYPRSISMWQWIFGIALFSLIIYGILTLERYKLLIMAYLSGTFVILFLWPDVWIGIRFMLPAVPFLVIGLVNGLQRLLVKFSPQVIRRFIVWVPILICISFFPNIKKLHKQGKAETKAQWANYYSLANWTKENLDQNTVVACRKPALFYLYSNCFTTNYMFTDDSQELINNLLENQVDYVVIDQLGYSSSYRYLFPVVRNNPDRFELIQEQNNPDTYLFRLIK